MSSLRADRAAHQREYAKAAGLMPDLDTSTTLVVNDWHFAGRDYRVPPNLLTSSPHPTGGVPCPGSC